jgi:hypothetical protein
LHVKINLAFETRRVLQYIILATHPIPLIDCSWFGVHWYWKYRIYSGFDVIFTPLAPNDLPLDTLIRPHPIDPSTSLFVAHQLCSILRADGEHSRAKCNWMKGLMLWWNMSDASILQSGSMETYSLITAKILNAWSVNPFRQVVMVTSAIGLQLAEPPLPLVSGPANDGAGHLYDSHQRHSPPHTTGEAHLSPHDLGISATLCPHALSWCPTKAAQFARTAQEKSRSELILLPWTDVQNIGGSELGICVGDWLAFRFRMVSICWFHSGS